MTERELKRERETREVGRERKDQTRKAAVWKKNLILTSLE